MSKKVTWVGVYGPHTQVKCLLKALIFGTCRKDIIMHSQMGFQLHQSHSVTVTGLKGGKKVQILGLCGPFRDLDVAFKLKLQIYNLSHTKIIHRIYI